jgi:ATP-dependent Clp protease ATP-binding subunit ClpB
MQGANKFTDQVTGFLQSAVALAEEGGQQQVTPLHLAVPVIDEGLGKQAVVKAAGDEAWRSLCRTLRKRLVRLPKVSGGDGGEVFMGPALGALIKKAQKEQRARGDAYLGVDVLLATLLHDGDVAAAMGEAGVTPAAVEAAVKEVRPPDQKVDSASADANWEVRIFISKKLGGWGGGQEWSFGVRSCTRLGAAGGAGLCAPLLPALAKRAPPEPLP